VGYAKAPKAYSRQSGKNLNQVPQAVVKTTTVPRASNFIIHALRTGSGLPYSSDMRLSIFAASSLAAFAFLAGCGGNSVAINPNSSPYFGSYAGEVYAGNTGSNGAVEFSVSSSGAISGSYTIASSTTTFTGSMSRSGLATITDSSGSTSTGQFGVPDAPTSEAMFSTSTGSLDFVVLRDPTGARSGGNKFNGEYMGTVTNESTGTTEPICVSINSTGALTGDQVVDDSGAAALGQVGGSVTSNGTATLTISVGGSKFETVSGDLTTSNGTISGTGTDSSGHTIKFKMFLF